MSLRKLFAKKPLKEEQYYIAICPKIDNNIAEIKNIIKSKSFKTYEQALSFATNLCDAACETFSIYYRKNKMWLIVQTRKINYHR